MKKLFAIVAVAFALSACSVTQQPLVDTPAKRLVQVDGLYKATAKTVTEGVIKGTIAGDNLARVRAAMDAARVALDLWTVNPSDFAAEQKAVATLQLARSLLQSVMPAPQSKLAEPEGFNEPWQKATHPIFICSSTSCSRAGLTTSSRKRTSTHFSRVPLMSSGTYRPMN